nr:uncharacterized protein LOC128688395 [Cherax quadricarinatus]
MAPQVQKKPHSSFSLTSGYLTRMQRISMSLESHAHRGLELKIGQSSMLAPVLPSSNLSHNKPSQANMGQRTRVIEHEEANTGCKTRVSEYGQVNAEKQPRASTGGQRRARDAQK